MASETITNADYFLELATSHGKSLAELDGRVMLGSDGFSPHFAHAFGCSVFAAVAVEHAISELLYVRSFHQVDERRDRQAWIQLVRETRSTSGRLALLRMMTRIDEDDLARIRDLFHYRNRVVHADIRAREGRVVDFETAEAINASGRGDELDLALNQILEDGSDRKLERLLSDFGVEPTRSLHLPGISTEDLEAAAENLAIARKAITLLRDELSRGWPDRAQDA